MANILTGRVKAVSEVQTIRSKDASKQPIVKRQLWIDCTRFDPYTGERGFENTPLLDFSHKGLEKLEELVKNGLKKDDVVTISFDVQGTSYKDSDGKMQVFTSIRPYNIELFRPKTENSGEQAAAKAQDGQNENDLPF